MVGLSQLICGGCCAPKAHRLTLHLPNNGKVLVGAQLGALVSALLV